MYITIQGGLGGKSHHYRKAGTEVFASLLIFVLLFVFFVKKKKKKKGTLELSNAVSLGTSPKARKLIFL